MPEGLSRVRSGRACFARAVCWQFQDRLQAVVNLPLNQVAKLRDRGLENEGTS